MKHMYSKLTALGICLLLLLTNTLSGFAESYPVNNSNDNLTANNTLSQDENRSSVISPQFSHINNIVIFLRFPSTLHPDNEFVNNDSLSLIDSAYNTGANSIKGYVNRMSYNEMDVDTAYFPKNADGTYYSYVAPQKVYYYCDYGNLGPGNEGYKNPVEQEERRIALITNAINAVKDQIEATFTPDELDTNGDGKIDSIQIFADTREGSARISYGDLLWPHQNAIENITIAGKVVDKYNLNTTVRTSFSAELNTLESFSIVHEFMHILGFPDTYDTNQATMPVGEFDIMSFSNGTPPPLLQYMQREYCNWGTPIDTITSNGTYTLKLPQYNDKDIDGGTYGTPETAYILKSPFSHTEFFVIQCAAKTVDSDKTNGVIIYRINTTQNLNNGNRHPNYLYIWRKDDTFPIPTNMKADYLDEKCVLSSETNLTSVGKTRGTETYGFDAETLYFSDGTNSGIVINNIGSGNANTISFNVTIPNITPPDSGTGTTSNPYIISNADQFSFIYCNPNNSYKLLNDIDFSACNYTFEPIKNFSGTFDGNHKKILNLNLNSNLPEQYRRTLAFFDSVTGGTVKNLTFVEPQILNQGRGGAAVLASGFTGTIQNVIIQSGTVNSTYGDESSQAASIVGTLTGTMENCFSSASVNGYLAGGLVVLNNGSMINSYCTGSVTGTIVGGLIGNFMHSNIKHCFSSGTVNGTTYTGGIVGYIRMTPISNITITDTFWNSTTSGTSAVGNIENYTGEPDVTAPSGMIGVGIPANLSFNSSVSQQLTVTTTPADTPVTGTWGATPFYSNVSVSSTGLVTPLYNGESPVTYTIPVGDNQMVLTANASVSNMQDPPKTLITKVDSTYAMLNGTVGRTTMNNGSYTTVKLVNNITMMPVRFLAETMGLTVSWNEAAQSTVITNPATGEYLMLQIGSTAISKYSQDGTLIASATMPAATTTIESSTYAPARIVAESFGFQVEYLEYADSEIFVITSNRTPAWTAEEIAAMCADASGKI